ncbi:MAG: 5'/3'-nucleotidase SurE [Candidatus Eisenbacteria sp.]|nr:5'/3'-nucleotidase SurE [Candidatus Eisenbacteria bacterium]
MRILLTNDDGIAARGLTCLANSLQELGDVWIVAPDREQSAASHALTLHDPLRVTQHGKQRFSVSGTPTDCVLLAVRGIGGVLEHRPDLVVAGINHGPNMGDDVTYSGTVAAAFEGRLLGLPAVAFSNVTWKSEFLDASARVAKQVVTMMLRQGLPRELLLNVNIPDLAFEQIRGFKITALGRRVYRDEIVSKVDPRGRAYYWIGGDPPVWEPEETSDFGAVSTGHVSITPLNTNWTDHAALQTLRSWDVESAWQPAVRPEG